MRIASNRATLPQGPARHLNLHAEASAGVQRCNRGEGVAKNVHECVSAPMNTMICSKPSTGTEEAASTGLELYPGYAGKPQNSCTMYPVDALHACMHADKDKEW